MSNSEITEKKQNNHASFLITDTGFLVPSLVTALQIHQGYSHLTDVLIYLTDCTDELFDKLKDTFPQITFIKLDTKKYVPPEEVYYLDNHVPVASMARLVIYDFLPEQYDYVLYIDGDMQIVGDITPLLTYEVPEGYVACVSGSYWMDENWKQNQKVKAYLDFLGIEKAEDYSNSGMMAFARKSWQKIGNDALEFYFKKADERMISHDQGAINAILARDNTRIHLPPAYNFHDKFAALGIDKSYPPKIVHFTGPHKPWLYIRYPWKPFYVQPYIQLLEAAPFLQEFIKMPSRTSNFRYMLHCLRQMWQGEINFKEMGRRRKIFEDYVNAQNFPIT